jgi:lysophospholipase L1-like esterase
MMPFSPRTVLLLLLGALAVVLVYDAVRIARALALSEQTTSNGPPYESRPADSRAYLLVVGDSTAVGTGAKDSSQSVAGRIGAAFPRVQVNNEAQVGARVQDLNGQLDAAPKRTYDALLIQVGGNDILRFSTLGTVEDGFDAVLERAREIAQHVVVIAPGDIGSAPAIPWPVSVAYSFRSSQLRRRLAIIADLRDVAFVDLEAATGKNPFEENPKDNYSRDGLHPSGNGYGHWYEALRDVVPLELWLERRDPAAVNTHHD